MNIVGSIQNQDAVNKPSMSNNLNKMVKPAAMATPASSAVPEVPKEVLSLFVNMIAELLGLLKPDQSNNSGFSLDFPSLPTYRDGDNSGGSIFSGLSPLPTMNNKADSSTNGSSLNLPPLTSLTGASSSQPASGSTPAPSDLSTDRTLNVAPLPSLVSPATGSLSTTDLPKAFNPPAISSLTGNSLELPSVNVSDSAPKASDLSTGRALKVAPLPSLVSPATGSLSTTDLPKAFNPPAIPSLTGGSTALPSVNADSNANTSSAPIEGSNQTSNVNTNNIFAIPDLLGSSGVSIRPLDTAGIPIPSLMGNNTLSALSSARGFSLEGANGIVDNSSTSDNANKSGSNHFK